MTIAYMWVSNPACKPQGNGRGPAVRAAETAADFQESEQHAISMWGAC